MISVQHMLPSLPLPQDSVGMQSPCDRDQDRFVQNGRYIMPKGHCVERQMPRLSRQCKVVNDEIGSMVMRLHPCRDVLDSGIAVDGRFEFSIREIAESCSLLASSKPRTGSCPSTSRKADARADAGWGVARHAATARLLLHLGF